MNRHCPSDGPRNCQPSGRLYSFIYILHGMVVYGPHEKGPESRIHVLSTMGSSHRWCPQKPRCSMVFRFTQEMKDCLRVQRPTNGRNGISSNCICCASWILLDPPGSMGCKNNPCCERMFDRIPICRSLHHSTSAIKSRLQVVLPRCELAPW